MPVSYKDYYQILGVAKTADAKAIKSAYRKLARKYDSDQNPENKGTCLKVRSCPATQWGHPWSVGRRGS